MPQAEHNVLFLWVQQSQSCTAWCQVALTLSFWGVACSFWQVMRLSSGGSTTQQHVNWLSVKVLEKWDICQGKSFGCKAWSLKRKSMLDRLQLSGTWVTQERNPWQSRDSWDSWTRLAHVTQKLWKWLERSSKLLKRVFGQKTVKRVAKAIIRMALVWGLEPSLHVGAEAAGANEICFWKEQWRLVALAYNGFDAHSLVWFASKNRCFTTVRSV